MSAVPSSPRSRRTRQGILLIFSITLLPVLLVMFPVCKASLAPVAQGPEKRQRITKTTPKAFRVSPAALRGH